MTTQNQGRAAAFPSEEAKRKLVQSYAQLMLEPGIDRAVWSRYFTGKRSLTLQQCQRVATALRLDALDFVAALLERVATEANSGSTD